MFPGLYCSAIPFEMKPEFLTLHTTLSPETLKEKLQRWEPWRHRIDFDNGVSTKDFKRDILFSEQPLKKFSLVETAIPFGHICGAKLLDIGCNAGYNSIYAAMKYQFSATGVDNSPRHIEVSKFLAGLSDLSCDFHCESAETFSRPGGFDVVLHFGTLYHLPNPLLSLQRSFENLKPGGYLALETQVYDHPQDPNICYFMHMQHNDPSNFWALSTPVLKKNLELIGFASIREIKKFVLPVLPEHMGRIVLVARKPAVC
jgi:2-polyprenyl-3-methyl-5-hydroxy-6-metoxy-1,4-benzoquinol methylase